MDTATSTDVAARIRAAGLRVTPQRRAILGVFEGPAAGHLSAEEVYERARATLPELARATVYKALTELVRVGLLRSVEGLGPVRYDPNLDQSHQHFHCLRCGLVYDVHPRDPMRIELAEGGFTVERTKVLWEGTCPACAGPGEGA